MSETPNTAEEASAKLFAQIKSIVQGMYPAILDDLDDAFLDRLKTFYDSREQMFQKKFDTALAELAKKLETSVATVDKSKDDVIKDIITQVDDFAKKLGAPENFSKALVVAKELEKPVVDLWTMITRGNLTPKQMIALIVTIVSLAITIFGLVTGKISIPAMPP